MNHNKTIIIAQVLFLLIVGALLFYLYPRTDVSVDGDFVRFSSVNAKVVMISDNPDFRDPRYIDLSLVKNLSINLAPGKYYYKPDNGFIEGFSSEFEIRSEVGMRLNKSDNQTDIENIGNVKINITKGKGGVMVGHIVLDPSQDEIIEDSGEYVGREAK